MKATVAVWLEALGWLVLFAVVAVTILSVPQADPLPQRPPWREVR